ncbi:TIGR03088 family PEP-CTERM/XrtA system glycosyltransferase [Undibacterium terreum]|uniref:Glycosyl transferase family 1 n=1 Tax=Undibacterium terreum TaxID=1224302 RepID=A0A916XS87_9BURK|nr:TIGR03088 family PEP-CTERM/XrtA system glycosyltransferase [Undibacterium terreum]GGC97148.1 glycosyl transferase family 1 [Undibacterium terreum]
MRQLPLVVHLVYRLDFGGLETVLAECVNRMPADKYRHAVVCLTDFTSFAKKITKPGVEIIALHKPAGLGLKTHLKLWKLLRKLRPAILHTYNLAAIEYSFTAKMAGVPICIHAEHGRDLSDPEGKNPKHNMLRRLLIPFIDCYIPVSRDLRQWLKDVIRVPDAKNLLINNGVDTERFHAAPNGLATEPFVVGTVGRVQDIKNHKGLVIAFQRLLELMPEHKEKLRLHIIGDGPLMRQLQAQVDTTGPGEQIWLAGARSDIAELMREFSVFVLPSFAEGTPVTLLEAMSSGLPVIASAVGGIPDVLDQGRTGILVSASDHEAIAASLADYFRQPAKMAQHGIAGRELVEQNYSIAAMLQNYMKLYDALCQAKL